MFARYSVSLGQFEINDYVSAFRQVLAEGGWTITDGSMFEDEPIPFLYARRGLEEVNITLKQESEDRLSVSVAHFESQGE